MKKYLSPVLPVIALTLALCMSGCGSIAELIDDAQSSPSQSEPMESDPIEDVPDVDELLDGKTLSEDGVLGSFKVALCGADRIELSDSSPALIVYYDFTNSSQSSISPFMALGMNVYQSEKPLDKATTFDDYPYNKNSSLSVRPGTTIRCSSIYRYSEDIPEVVVEVFDWAGDASLVLLGIYDTENLPGETGTFELAPVASPTGTDGLPRQAVINGCELSISSEHAATTDWNGNSCIRLSLSFTNSNTEAVNFANDFSVCAYQDGVELPTASSSEALAEDSNAWQDIAGGGSVTINLIYSKRSSSPIELEISGGDGGTIGAKFNVA